ncbi:MAG: hypothetical protein IKO57_04475 [Treponema sp.]|nr:hypothetical protein [Treponema sp.]
MTGAYEIIVKNRRVQYKFTINRNITILKGDSATGKTTLIEMISAYQRNGEKSGIQLSCKKNCVVLDELNWELNLSKISDSIVFIDEGSPFITSQDFAQAAKKSDNYYVIATRTNLHNIPYSTKEIYGIKNASQNRYQGTKQIYNEFYPLYDKITSASIKPELIIVEDSKSGYEFFSAICKKNGIDCESADGKSNIYKKLLPSTKDNVLVIADGAAFGSEIEDVLEISHIKNLGIYLPESFEWLVLKANLMNDGDVNKILEQPSAYIESADYFSWEIFFTKLLMDKTHGTYLSYTKKELNPAYLQDKESKAILSVMPEEMQSEFEITNALPKSI